MNFLKKLDAYPKTIEDFRVRTYSGAAVSIISTAIIALLFFSELSFYLTEEVHHELFVDTTRGEKLKINIDIIFPSLPCSYVSLDAMDMAGEHQLDVAHNIYKKRIDHTGKPLGVVKEDVLGSLVSQIAKEKKNPTPSPPPAAEGAKPSQPACGSCYGAENELLKCCNNCEDVREAYRQKGWAFSNPDGIEQCAREGWTDKMKDQQNEGCQIYGYLLVNKVAGNFHFAPGKSFQQHSMHVHDLQPFKWATFNISHQIVRLSFGTDFPGIVNPLDGVKKVSGEGSTMYQYFVKIVPTIYESGPTKALSTNQFSVTEHDRVVDAKNPGGHGLPGVFFMYDLSPIMVKLTKTQKSFSQFLTGVCAIIGGIYTVAGLIDSFIYSATRSLEKKIQIGKAN
eukprot:TRINITY_DN6209_c0_g2_i1.p1 TRINITY_DN6209_c0_g2~~TRINITY_DN6209_c0_g2_i1.p1  ORF type:complete len:395 (+),score=84.60 TRINITY_DN6209_c0_g2_i1:80-1264(+)